MESQSVEYPVLSTVPLNPHEWKREDEEEEEGTESSTDGGDSEASDDADYSTRPAQIMKIGELSFYGGEGGSKTLSEVMQLSSIQRLEMRKKQHAENMIVSIHNTVHGRSVLTGLSAYNKTFRLAQVRGPDFKLDAKDAKTMANSVFGRNTWFCAPKITMVRELLEEDPVALLSDLPIAVVNLVTHVAQKVSEKALDSSMIPPGLIENAVIPARLQETLDVRDQVIYYLLANQFKGRVEAQSILNLAGNPEDKRLVTPIERFPINYRLVTPWRAVGTVLMNKYSDKMNVPESVRLNSIYAYNIIATVWTLTNGCMEGQLRRLQDTTRVKNELLREYPETAREWTMDEMFQAMEMLGVSANPAPRPVTWWHETLTVGIDPTNSEVINGLFRVETTASSGLGWEQGTKRKATLLSDIGFNCEIMQLVAQAEETGGVDILLEAMKAFKIVQIKPKFEITKVEKMRTKIRNIFVFGSYWQVSLGIFMQLAKRNINQPFQGGGLSLSGFNPMYGGINDVIDNMLGQLEENKTATCFYSDNCYFMRSVNNAPKWYSCDVEKMESTSTATEGAQTMRLLMITMGLDPDSALGKYLQFMGGYFSHDCPGIIGDMIIPTPGMASGSQITFLNNHTRMSLGCKKLRDLINSGEVDLEKVKDGAKIPIPKGSRIFFNVEKTTDDRYFHNKDRHGRDLYPIYARIRKCTLEEALQPETPHAGTLATFGSIVRLDLLGFDATPVDLPPEYASEAGVKLVACLDFERLMKAICFRKTKMAKESRGNAEVDTETDFLTSFISIMTMQTLYIVGGFAYPEADYIIKGIVALLQQNLHAVMITSVQSAFDSGLTNEQIVAARAETIRRQILTRFSGGELSEFVPSDLVDTLTNQIDTMVDQALRGDFSDMNKYIDRATVIRKFHTKAGLEERKREIAEARKARDEALGKKKKKGKKRPRENDGLNGMKPQDYAKSEMNI